MLGAAEDQKAGSDQQRNRPCGPGGQQEPGEAGREGA
jgi:hypothetical protein